MGITQDPKFVSGHHQSFSQIDGLGRWQLRKIGNLCLGTIIFFSNRLIGPMAVKKKRKKEADIKDPMRI
jgi:hypothetical protein